MSETKTARRRLAVALGLLAAAAAGVFLAQLLPPDIFGLRGGAESQTAEAAAASGQLWTCGMHPQVIQDEPGQCPICGMNLTPMLRTPMLAQAADESYAGHVHAATKWVCPDHPNIVENEPGSCPIDGQALVAKVPEEAEREILFYRNPMDPRVTSPEPAVDSMGMAYVPVYADEAAPSGSGAGSGGATVRIDPAVVQNMNVRTETVERRDLTRPIRTVGHLEFDQQRMVTVTTRYSGWIEKVYVNYVGEKVRRGQPLFEIYSPELVQTEQELLSALEFSEELSEAPEDARQRALSMIESARIRLGYWDVSPQQVAELEASGEVFRTLKVAAPAGGVVMKRLDGLEGMAVQPGMELFHIADLSSLWLSVELFEEQLAWVHEGTAADIALSYFPGEAFRGTVRFLEPELSEMTRTMRAMIEVDNRDGRLRKGMYATVTLKPVVLKDVLAVPTQAVLRSGQRDVVVEALGDGRFVPREVRLGEEAGGFTVILSGLEEGATVVTSAQFLLDSESRLREAVQRMVVERGAGEPSAPAPPSASGPPAGSASDDHEGHR